MSEAADRGCAWCDRDGEDAVPGLRPSRSFRGTRVPVLAVSLCAGL